MFRKISFAAFAALALTAAAVVPASAGHGGGGHSGGHGGGFSMHSGGHGHGGYWGGHRHGRFFGSAFYAGGSCYKTVFTQFGPRRVYVCNGYY